MHCLHICVYIISLNSNFCILLISGKFSIADSFFLENSAGAYGGAVSAVNLNWTTVYYSNCQFLDNIAVTDSGVCTD